MHSHPTLPPATSTKWLGATLNADKTGTDFVFYAGKDATNVELCLFDHAEGHDERPGGKFNLQHKEEVRNDKGEIVGYLWHGFAEGVGEGQLYGFRVDGPLELGYNPNKLLIDPAAKAISHDLKWDESMRGIMVEMDENGGVKLDENKQPISLRGNDGNIILNLQNDGKLIPKARVVDWQKLQKDMTNGVQKGALRTHADSIICEAHIKGSTIDIKEPNQSASTDNAISGAGRYSGLCNPHFMGWMKHMAVSTLEVMPAGAHGGGYWGYSPVAPMAAHVGYASPGMRPEEEFAKAIRTLKQNDIEIMMDVVPNHTHEGNMFGPVLNMRKMDPAMYAREDVSGCGNTRDFGHPINRRLFLEELKYWAGMGVSGFRIDLATALGREHSQTFNPNAAMMQLIRNDPDLANIKFVGEPWDNLGQFYGQLAHTSEKENYVGEWNDFFRDSVQTAAFNAKHDTWLNLLIDAIAGTSKRFIEAVSGPQMSVNYVQSHDGASWFDLLSYPKGKTNGGGNQIPPEFYWGKEEDRWRVMRFASAIRAISQGVPMMTMGHERGHTQNGHTDPHDEDNTINFIPWHPGEHAIDNLKGRTEMAKGVSDEGRNLMNFTAAANQFRMKHACLRRATYFTGKVDEQSDLTLNGERLKDVTWLRPAGGELTERDMHATGGFGMLLSGDPGNSPEGEKSFVRRVIGRSHEDPVLVLVNSMRPHEGWNGDIEFTLPEIPGVKWRPVLDSLGHYWDNSDRRGGQKVTVGWRSIQAFEAVRERDLNMHCQPDQRQL